ncbi:MAG TPA: asparagine synthase-related protein, partial [Ramlibacter sp.]|nr:asparagine synthase-related protein [Ramlibacter sp.]
ARLDDRQALVQSLILAGQPASLHDDPARLILLAYAAWDTRCLDHLHGDFAFALWDAARGELFCARDPMGVRPLFYAFPSADSIVVGNALESVRRTYGDAPALDDDFIADFLLFGASVNPQATAFHEVTRLEAGQSLHWSARDGARTRAYWHAPVDEFVEHPGCDHAEELARLLSLAIGDRSPESGASILMSGGLDSTSLAALARELELATIDAHTVSYATVVPDQEAGFAAAAANRLGIVHHIHEGGGYQLFDAYRLLRRRYPEPMHDPEGAVVSAMHARVAAAGTHAMLTGIDCDSLLNENPKPFIQRLLARGRVMAAARTVAAYAWRERRLPHAWQRRAAVQPAAYPEWLNPDFEARLDLRERWRAGHAASPGSDGLLRPNANTSIHWLRNFYALDRFDPAVTGERIEFCHPFMDARVMRFCLTLPPVPHCVKKAVLRSAMARRLPRAVLDRPKTPFRHAPLLPMLARPGSSWIDGFTPSAALSKYVDGRRMISIRALSDAERAWADLKPLSLDLWLTRLHEP